jgi:hypothetical protein
MYQNMLISDAQGRVQASYHYILFTHPDKQPLSTHILSGEDLFFIMAIDILHTKLQDFRVHIKIDS